MEGHQGTRGSTEESASPKGRRLVSTLPERIDEILESLEAPGSTVLLIGEAGTGKSRIAQEAAYSLEARLGGPVSVTVLLGPEGPVPSIGTLLALDAPGDIAGAMVSEFTADQADPQSGLQRVLTRIAEAEGDAEWIIVAAGIDEYPPVTAYLFEQLVRARKVRIIATAHHLAGAAAQISCDPRVVELHIARFTPQETGRYLHQILGCELVESQTVEHWHRLTRGSPFALQMLATAMERAGRLGRRRGVVWQLAGAEGAPEEFGAYLRSVCSPEELRAFSIIAAAEPLSEGALRQLLDPDALASLRRRGLVVSQTLPTRASALSTVSPVFREAILHLASPEERTATSRQLFDVLLAESTQRGAEPPVDRVARLVRLGLDAERDLPLRWLWQAMEWVDELEDPAWLRRVALAVAAHPEATAEQRGVAAVRAARVTRISGDAAHPAEVIQLLARASEALIAAGAGTSYEAIAIEVELVRALRLDSDDHARANRRLDELAARVAAGIPDASDDRVAVVQAKRAYALACAGHLRAAGLVCDELSTATEAPLPARSEWARQKARIVAALLRAQQGRYAEAMRIAGDAKFFAGAGAHPQREEADLLTFAHFFAVWSSGSLEASRDALGGLEGTVFSHVARSGLVETAAVLHSLLEGRWRLAAQEADRVRDRLDERDVYGLRPLVNAAHGLALAALGSRDESVRAIREAERQQHGLAQAMVGALRLLTLRARQWNEAEDALAEAKRLATWAADQGLADIELKALHAGLMIDADELAPMLPRIEALATRIDLPLGALLARHCEEILGRAGSWDSPTARTLAEFGVWMPLPKTSRLSEREREIALLASLGYSSRWIADQYFLSVRTVETHLRHVFTKLGASNRDELRLWFRRERQPV